MPLLSLRILIAVRVLALATLLAGMALGLTRLSLAAWPAVNNALLLLGSLASAVALAWLLSARRRSAGVGLLQAALALAAAEVILGLVYGGQLLFSMPGGFSAFLWLDNLLRVCVNQGALLLLWLALTPIAAEVQARDAGLSPPFLVLWALRFVIAVARATAGAWLFPAIGASRARELLTSSSYVSLVLGAALHVLVIVLLSNIAGRMAIPAARDEGTRP
jgi:hypothetical protein